MTEINNQVFDFLKSRIKADLSQDDDIFELRLVNSLFYIQLINFIESSFLIKIENDDLDLNNFNTSSNIAKFVEGKVASRPLTA